MCIVMLCSACSSQLLTPALSKQELIQVPAEYASQRPRMDYQLLHVDEEMQEFVRSSLVDSDSTNKKLRKLLTGMRNRGLGDLNYQLDLTYTAQDTFHLLKGNCLSFTNLFVALAREAGLSVRYQMVEIPPKWDGDASGLVILNHHINVLVELRNNPDYLVDFNLFAYQDNYKTELVSDSYAESMFYSNLAVEALQKNNYAASFWYLNRALLLYSDVASVWINLGVLYSRIESYQHAESAFLQALILDAGNKSALTNLAGLYSRLGDVERAGAYAKMVNYYRDRNPYYHYSLANHAFEEGNYLDTLTYIARSVKLKKVEHQFHYLRSRALVRLGRPAQAKRSLRQAHKYAVYQETRDKYAQELRSFRF